MPAQSTFHLTRLTICRGSLPRLAATRFEMSNAPSHHPLTALQQGHEDFFEAGNFLG
jgi:hypothetical protein